MIIRETNGKLDTLITGENTGYYGSGFTDQNLDSLMKKGGMNSARVFLSIYNYKLYGMSTFTARFKYPYDSLHMRHNVFNLNIQVSDGNYTGRDTTTVGGHQTWLPSGLYLNPFNVDSSINTSNVWAKFCYDVISALKGKYDYYEVDNEPDANNVASSNLDSITASSTSFQKHRPLGVNLTSLYAPHGDSDYVQLCKITYQVIKHVDPTAKICTGGFLNPYYHIWFIRDGGYNWVDMLDYHYYPYMNYGWGYWNNSTHMNSDGALYSMDSMNNIIRRGEASVSGGVTKPIMVTETNVPGWPNNSGTTSLPTYLNWSTAQIASNYAVKLMADFNHKGYSHIDLFNVGCYADSGVSNTTDQFPSMGLYFNLSTTSFTHEAFTQQGRAMKAFSRFQYWQDTATTATFPTGVRGFRFDSAGYKMYMVWADQNYPYLNSATASTSRIGDTTLTATYTVPTGASYLKFDKWGNNLGIVSGSITLTGDPIYLVQTGPVCNAGTAQTIIYPNVSSLKLDGSASTGTITSYNWTFLSGPVTPTISTPTLDTTTVSGMYAAGNYSFQLSINSGAVTCTITDTVKAHIVPTASAGSNQTITLPSSVVSLTGTSTTYDGATVASRLWTKISGSGTIISPTSASTSVTSLTAGVSVFQYVVTDSRGSSSNPSTVTITVNNAPYTGGSIMTVRKGFKVVNGN